MTKSAFGYDKVAEVCRKIMEQGETPTLRSVREGVGMGSMSTILKHLQQWQRDHELAATVEDDLSPVFKQAVLAECARKLSAVRDRLQSQLDERENRINELHAVLSESEKQAEVLTAELAKVKKETEAMTLEYEKKLAAAHEQVIVRTEYAHELTQKTDAQFTALREQIRQMQEEKHQSDIKAAAAEARNAELEKRLSQ